MKDYKRLTERIIASNTGRTVLVVPSFKQDIIEQTHRLADLEDKIERGEIVDRNEYLDYLLAAKDTSELTNKDKEIEFFVKHNARVREDTDKELASLTAERDIMKAALDNLIFYCTNDKKFMCEAVSEKCPRGNGTLLCGSDECDKIMLDFYIEEAKRELKYEITEERK